MEGQIDAVVGNAALGIVVGTDTLGTVTAADLGAALAGTLGLLALLFGFVELGAQDLHGAVLVLVLRTLVLALDNNAGGDVGDTDGRLGLVDVLAAGTAGTVGVDLQVGRVDLDVNFFGLGQNGNGRSRSLDAARAVGDGNALDTVAAALVLEAGPCALTFDQEADFLDAAQLGLVDVHDFDGEALAFGIHGIHTVEIGSKQSSFFAAYAAADFDDNVLFVVGVLGKQQDLELFFQFGHTGLCVVDLHKGHIADVGIFVTQQFLSGCQISLGSLITAVGFDNGSQLLLLAEQIGGTLGIAVQVALLESVFDFEQSGFNCGKFVQHIL